MAEEWRPVVGYEGRYLVSDHGRVWSLLVGRALTLRENAGYRRRDGVVIQYGYKFVKLSDSEGRNRTVHVASLVLEAFVERRPGPWPGTQARHRNGRPWENYPWNLAWGTPKEQSADKAQHGTHNNTQKTACKRRGHLLEGANLGGYDKQTKGWRRCRACHAGYFAELRARKRGEEVDRDAYADQVYERLMGYAA